MTSEYAKQRRRERDRLKKARKRAKKRRSVIAAVGINKTCPAYRRQLPMLPEMTKNELRAMIAQAVRNTAGSPA